MFVFLFCIVLLPLINADEITITSPLNDTIVADFGGGTEICIGLGSEINRSNATVYIDIGGGNFSFYYDYGDFEDSCVYVNLGQSGEYDIIVYVDDGVHTGSDTITISAYPSGWSNWEVALAIIFGIIFFTFLFAFVNLNCCDSDKPLQIFFLILAFFFLTLSLSMTTTLSQVRILPLGLINLIHTSYIISLWILLLIVAYVIVTFLSKILLDIKIKKEQEKEGEWKKW